MLKYQLAPVDIPIAQDSRDPVAQYFQERTFRQT